MKISRRSLLAGLAAVPVAPVYYLRPTDTSMTTWSNLFVEDGVIKAIRIWPRVLSDEELAAEIRLLELEIQT